MRQFDLLPSLADRDVERLLAERDPAARALVAEQVGGLLTEAPLNEAEQRLACEIVEILSCDLDVAVREAVALSLRNCPLLPHRIALRLAEDVESVALPVLQASEVLREGDLIALVRHGNLAKQLAIAARKLVSPALADSLLDTARPAVIARLLDNPGAELGEPALDRALDLAGEDPAVQRAIVRRLHLPLTVQQRLIGALSQELSDLLIERHGLPKALIERFVHQGAEGALTRLARRERRVEEVEALIRRLHAEGRLTATLVLRALLEGDLHLFEAALAQLAGVPTANARTVIYYGGPGGLRRLYDRTGLPADLFSAVRSGVEVAGELGFGAGERPRRDAKTELARRTIERIVETYREVYPAPLETVLSQLALQAGAAENGARG